MTLYLHEDHPTLIDEFVPEIVEVEAYASTALQMFDEMHWPRSNSREEYLARARLATLLNATADAAKRLTPTIQIPFRDHSKSKRRR